RTCVPKQELGNDVCMPPALLIEQWPADAATFQRGDAFTDFEEIRVLLQGTFIQDERSLGKVQLLVKDAEFGEGPRIVRLLPQGGLQLVVCFGIALLLPQFPSLQDKGVG